MKENYYMGLDMGTGSLGWAVTDKNYHILKKHGKSLWGVRLFESASPAKDRRMFRTGRRRLARRSWRIQILQELFAEEISKIDPGFFLRMKESKYYPEDKRDMDGKCPELPYALFVDKEYTDKDYHREFPTIYHLRKMLMETADTPDIRLVYLAFHHMMKHRGHFLLSGDISQVTDFKNTFLQFIENVKKEELDFKLEEGEEKITLIKETLQNNNLTKSSKKTRLIKELTAKTKCEKAIWTLLSGGTVKLYDIFGRDDLKDCEQDKISFSDSKYEEYAEIVALELGEQFYIIESAKAVYDWSVLTNILGNSESISGAKVYSYEKHKRDLKILKKIVKNNLSAEDYKNIFVMTKDKLYNYPAYIGMTKKNGRKTDLQGKRCSREEFVKFLKKNVADKIEDPDVREFLMSELENGMFLPRQVTSDNGVIPFQIHSYELKKILENLDGKLSFIHENAEKIVQLFEFRIPYYVGPLNKGSGNTDFSWAERREGKNNEKIYPWNFEEVIDKEASAEKFIRRMTNKCTYLVGEDVLPKDSLLYSKFMVLNELNNLRINGDKISVELKQKIYEDVFCRMRKVTQKKLKAYLVREGIIEKDAELTGIEGDFKTSLTAYHDFKEKLTGVSLSQKAKEEIILNIVLFGDDKNLLKNRLEKRFPELTEKQKGLIASLSYKGWGRFSKKFLEEVTAPAPETGEVWNIITALWETNDNLMQILSRNYLFKEKIDEINSEKTSFEFNYHTVDELYVSPAVKRQIWQTMQVVKEIEKVMGEKPRRVFVEMARGEDEKKQRNKRVDSRKAQLLALYKTCKKEESEWIRYLYGHLEKQENHQLRSDRLYLYYTQKGRCMYSGEIINLEDLWDSNKYDIDHIYPQSKTMDDSLDNRVLVKKEYNAKKTDNYPISHAIQEKMSSFWKALYNSNFITKKKYDRLIRKTELTSDELANFIDRQLVETRQSTKVVAEILKELLPETEIVYVKAKNVSKFRQTFDFVKLRELNDLHHAKDAYLNIVVGNSYFTKFTQNAVWYIKKNPGRTYNLEKMFERDINRNNEMAWKAGSDGTIVTVKKMMSKNNILVTRKVYEVKGGLFDQQIMKKGKGQVPIKSSDSRLCDIQKYGGYNKATGTYFMLVKSRDKKGKEQRTIEYIPLYLKNYIEQSEENALEYLRNTMKERKLFQPEILLKKIKTDTLFKVDGFYMWLSGRTGKQLIFKGAVQLLLSDSEIKELKKIVKFIQRQNEDKELKIVDEDKIEEEHLQNLYEIFLGKIRDTIYKTKLSAQEKTLVNGREIFAALSKEDKCRVLYEILHLFQCQSGSANLKLIDGPGNAGILLMNNNITNCKQISVITQSPTGIFEKEINLLKL